MCTGAIENILIANDLLGRVVDGIGEPIPRITSLNGCTYSRTKMKAIGIIPR